MLIFHLDHEVSICNLVRWLIKINKKNLLMGIITSLGYAKIVCSISLSVLFFKLIYSWFFHLII